MIKSYNLKFFFLVTIGVYIYIYIYIYRFCIPDMMVTLWLEFLV